MHFKKGRKQLYLYPWFFHLWCRIWNLFDAPSHQKEPVEVVSTLDWGYPQHVQLVGDPWGRPRTHGRDYISHLTWEHLGIPQENLENMWAALLNLLPPKSCFRQAAENGWMDGWIRETEYSTADKLQHFRFDEFMYACMNSWTLSQQHIEGMSSGPAQTFPWTQGSLQKASKFCCLNDDKNCHFYCHFKKISLLTKLQ